jgi:hypothetical protein
LALSSASLRSHSTALRELHASFTAMSFEDALSRLQSGTKGCDVDVGGCGAPAPIVHALDRPPAVYTISLAWEAAQAAQEDVAATLKARRVVFALLALASCSQQPSFACAGTPFSQSC